MLATAGDTDEGLPCSLSEIQQANSGTSTPQESLPFDTQDLLKYHAFSKLTSSPHSRANDKA
jgi:hypothetical protein